MVTKDIRKLVKVMAYMEAFNNASLSNSDAAAGSVTKQPFKEENRCCACGCFMEGFDCSTEAADDYDFKCNNQKCKSNNRSK